MNTLQKLLVCLMLGFVVVSYGCKKDEDDPVGCSNWADEVVAEGNAYNDAAVAYYSDPTNTAKCQAYKNAGQDYVNALQSHVECATVSGQQAQLQAIINSTQDAVDAIPC